MTTIDPSSVRQLRLPSGRLMPVAAYGTFHSDWAQALMKDATVEAIRVGWRHLDTARAYENEAEIGEAIRIAIRQGYLRSKDELFITGKLWNGHMKKRDVAPALESTLRDLGLDQIDLYLNHWPWPNVHPPGCTGNQRNPDAVPYIHEQFMETWGELVKLKKAGKIVHLGISNHTELTTRLLLRDVAQDERPVVNQMEMHPLFQQTELRRYFESEGILCTGYMAVGSPKRPARDTFKEHRADLQDPVILQIAAENGITPGQVALAWAAQRMNHSGGYVVMTTHSDRMVENLIPATKDLLSAEQMRRLDAMDANNRLIWGQVFLWPEADGDWRVLWDDSQVFEKTADYLRFKKAFGEFMAVKQQTTVRHVHA
jgi:diketogulonate reductase-like aldo/keto reductase